MLNLRNITKVYDKKSKNPCVAINDINLDFANTGMVFVTGESGCGKSTLLNIIGGLDIATSGKLYFENQHIHNKNATAYRSQEVSVIFQKFNLIDDITVEENMRIVYEIDNKSIDINTINATLAEVGLDKYNDRSVKELSGGEEQRLAIARAMLKKSKILLADEPTGNLDVANSEIVYRILKNLSKDILVIVVSHESDYVYKYADRIITIADGKVVSDKIKNQGVEDFIEVDGCGYISKQIFRSTLSKINDSHCERFALINDEKYKDNAMVLETIESRKYENNVKTHLSTATAYKLAFTKIMNHKIRFATMILAVLLVFSLFGTSIILANYDIGEISVSLIQKNGETSAMYRLGMEWPPFGYIDRSGWVIPEESEEYIRNTVGDKDLDEYYSLLGTLYITDNTNVKEKLSNYFSGYIESSLVNLPNYGFNILEGTYPTTGRINGKLQVALTDFTAYKINKDGAVFNANEYKIGLTAEELIGKTINLGSESFYITGIIDTDFDQYIPYIEEEVNSTAEVTTIYNSRVNLYYNVLYFAKNATKELFSNFVRYTDCALLNNTTLTNAVNGNTLTGTASDLRPPTVMWSDGKSAIDDNEVVLSSSYFRSYFGEGFKTNKEYVLPFALHSGTQKIMSGEFKVVGVINRINLDYLPHTTILTFSNKTFSEMVNGAPMLTGLHGKLPDGHAAKRELINTLVAGNCYHESMYSSTVYEMYNHMELYKTIFLYVSLLLLIIACIMIFDFFRVNIMDRKKDIGILMALGMNGWSTIKIFVLQIASITIALVLLIVVGILAFSGIMGAVLSAMLTKSISISVVTSIPTIVYTTSPFFISIAMLVISVVISATYPIIRIAKNSPINNVKI